MVKDDSITDVGLDASSTSGNAGTFDTSSADNTIVDVYAVNGKLKLADRLIETGDCPPTGGTWDTSSHIILSNNPTTYGYIGCFWNGAAWKGFGAIQP